MTKREAIIRFYDILSRLGKCVGGKRLLAECDGRNMKWPRRGVYFFFEHGEQRTTSGKGLRVVRVGTHAVKNEKEKTTLWGRLRDHRGSLSGEYAGGGNHRGSVFRKHVGGALLNKQNRYAELERWQEGSSASQAIRRAEHDIECSVSGHIRFMPFLWIEVDDVPGLASDRAVIEKNSIALLTSYHVDDPIDPPSSCWLGQHAHNDKVRKSGLWNDDFVDDGYDESRTAKLLEILEKYVKAMCHRIASANAAKHVCRF